MNWEAFFALLRAHPGKTVMGVVAVFGAATGFSTWLWQAESCHAQARADSMTVEQLVEFQRQIVKEKEIEAAENRKVIEERRRLCLAGEVKNPVLCAEAGVTVPSGGAQ